MRCSRRGRGSGLRPKPRGPERCRRRSSAGRHSRLRPPPHVDSRRAPRCSSPAVSSFVRGLHPAAGSEFGGQRALSSCRPPKRDIQTRSSARADSLFRETSSSSPSFSTSENLTDCALYFSHLRIEMQKRTQRGPRPPGSPPKLLPREPPTLRPAVSWLHGPLRS